MKKVLILSISIVMSLYWVSCGNDTPGLNPSEPSIEIDNNEIALDNNNVYDLSFVSAQEWTISLADTSQTGWCDVFPLTGEGGQVNVSINALPNDSYNDRSVILTLKSGDVEKTVTVFQEFGCGVKDINIPDKEFRAYCLDHYDTNEDGLISSAEVANVVELELNLWGYDYIGSIEGIEYFKSLRDVHIFNNYMVENFNFSFNKKLEKLIIYSEVEFKLDISKNTELKYLTLYRGVTDLDISNNAKLESLFCECSFTGLDTRNNPNLIYLECKYGDLKELDLSNNTALETIICSDNHIENLKLGSLDRLITLDCSYNELKTLNVSNCANLETLMCGHNLLTDIDVSKNSSLIILSCYDNLFSMLNMTNNLVIEYVACLNDNFPLSEIWLNKQLENEYRQLDIPYDTKVVYK